MNIRTINPPSTYSDVLLRISEDKIVPRIWAGDHTVWDPNPEEIVNRLGWLHLPNSMKTHVPHILRFVDSVREDGFTDVVLLGMGGSSLAPDTLAKVFGAQAGYPHLRILDSTHPESVSKLADELRDKKTLFIVATKSGTTTETLSLFRYFYQRTSESVGDDRAGSRFVAITDPGTPLVKLASQHGFREVFINDPNLGGRYSALSMFGLVPAALLGLDVNSFLQVAQSFAGQCSPATPPVDNPAVQLGSILGAWAQEGRDKATFLLSKPLTALGDWIEQLIAESTGKDGNGIVPILEASWGSNKVFARDRVFIALRLGDDPEIDVLVSQLTEDRHPVVLIDLNDTFQLAEQFFLWELATAIACHVLGVHPFNQPNVESAKQLARKMTEESRRTGNPPLLESTSMSSRAILDFLRSTAPGDYVGLQAYLPRTDGTTTALRTLQTVIRERHGIAVTVGYGPRFLHSTGQLHKGDRGNGHFIQLVSDTMPDVRIPDSARSSNSSLSFAALITSQALGDQQALESGLRPALTLGVPEPASETISAVAARLRRV